MKENVISVSNFILPFIIEQREGAEMCPLFLKNVTLHRCEEYAIL